jgi:hypothetical protein
VPGINVDTYSVDRIEKQVYDAYTFLFDKRDWKHLLNDFTSPLDGAGGVVTSDIAGLARYEDIVWVRKSPYSKDDEIFEAPDLEPEEIDYLCYKPLPANHVQFDTRFIQFFPLTAVNSVRIKFKYRAASFKPDTDKVPFPSQLLVHFICMRMLALDGINPDAKDEHETMFDQLYKDYIMEACTK